MKLVSIVLKESKNVKKEYKKHLKDLKVKEISIIKQYKIFNFSYIAKEYIKEHNPKWPEIPDHPYQILIIGGSGSGKTCIT